jgi:phage tail protein X
MADKYYIATDMDRWDNLAYDFYGDASLVAPLMAANPAILPSQIYLPVGAKIVVPDLPAELTQPAETTVKAPWK